MLAVSDYGVLCRQALQLLYHFCIIRPYAFYVSNKLFTCSISMQPIIFGCWPQSLEL